MTRHVRLLGKVIAATVSFAFLIPSAPATAAVRTFEAALTGGNTEVPDPGDPDGTGAAEVRIDARERRVCFTLVTLDIQLPAIAAHIHEGEAGVAGDIVVTLRPPEEVAGTGIGVSRGCVRGVNRALLRDIKQNPDQYYVNVHTSDFPGGAIRGQLAAA